MPVAITIEIKDGYEGQCSLAWDLVRPPETVEEALERLRAQILEDWEAKTYPDTPSDDDDISRFEGEGGSYLDE